MILSISNMIFVLYRPNCQGKKQGKIPYSEFMISFLTFLKKDVCKIWPLKDKRGRSGPNGKLKARG